MKTVVAVVLAAALGFGAAWLVSRGQRGAVPSGNESNWQQEKAYLEQQLADARKRGPDVRSVTNTVTSTVTNRLSAEEILERLVKLQPDNSEESRSRVFRQIVHYLQMLVDEGPEVLPVLQSFLKQNKDVDYSRDVLNAAGERVGRTGVSSFGSRSVAQTDFLVPPSLRLGLVDVLDQIGGEQAEAILAGMLDTTGRGVEVAYIARVLQESAPDKYRDMAIKAAKELLANPPAVDQPNRIDENSRAYLFQVLAMFNDTSFAQTAQGQLITPDGRIDRQVLNYLSTTLQEQSVAGLHAAYTSSLLSNRTDKTTLLGALLAFTGPSPQANQVFTDLISDDKIPAAVRAYSIENLAGGVGHERPVEPRVIESRLKVLKDLRGSLKDERVLRSIDDTTANLQKLLTTVTQPPPP